MRNIPLRAIAEAADLSISRIKQLPPVGASGGATAPAVTEIDIYLPHASRDMDRVLLLDDVDPWLETWPSERDFIGADEARQHGHRYDIVWDLYDGDPSQRWVAVYADHTHEVYAFAVSPQSPEGSRPTQWDRLGSSSGPCKLLGHTASYHLVEALINPAAAIASRRLGGLAWLHGRVQLVNTMLSAVISRDGLLNPEAVWTYLGALPENERPPGV